MIRPLRQLHRVVILALTLLLSALFMAALIVRKPAPANPQIPNIRQAPLQNLNGGQR
ncbi:MAG: hypothetical protein ACKVZH_27545 [Blastocatellia bacterium]